MPKRPATREERREEAKKRRKEAAPPPPTPASLVTAIRAACEAVRDELSFVRQAALPRTTAFIVLEDVCARYQAVRGELVKRGVTIPADVTDFEDEFEAETQSWATAPELERTPRATLNTLAHMTSGGVDTLAPNR